MPSRSMDWLKQAKRDLEEAEGSLNNEKYEWACFASQQSAEKAVIALYHSINKEIWSHSVSRMLLQLTEFDIDKSLADKAMELDRVYIGSRYPDYYTEGSPFEYYSIEDAKRCLNYAKEIFEFCNKNIRN
ncbi:HEPN superfamily protein [Ferroplasma acidiphilum]|nr:MULTISPECIES: HEPN domain-containing protein [Ferroplasma]ARD85395.1 HEPN superfamily protein [Ferroplasma acidiphilum]